MRLVAILSREDRDVREVLEVVRLDPIDRVAPQLARAELRQGCGEPALDATIDDPAELDQALAGLGLKRADFPAFCEAAKARFQKLGQAF